MEGHPHHCHYEGVEAIPDDNGRYCHCPVKHRATLGEIVNLFNQIPDFPADFIIPTLTVGRFEKNLHAMYLSYLPKEATIFDYKMNCDDRGRFTELVRTPDRGRFRSISVSQALPKASTGMTARIGNSNGKILVVSFTMRGDVYRIISARRATKAEETIYFNKR